MTTEIMIDVLLYFMCWLIAVFGVVALVGIGSKDDK